MGKEATGMDNVTFGRLGEEAAAKLLEASGYRILERNYRSKMGEVDIIASKGAMLSFIEVKTRQNYRYGRPCEAVDRKKQRRIKNTAMCYLKEANAEAVHESISFDVVEVVIEHMCNAF